MVRMLALLTLLGFLCLTEAADEQFDAVAWIQVHSQSRDGPGMGDMQELQAENPNAYALVKALLVKNSLGLVRRSKEASLFASDTGATDGSMENADTAVAASPIRKSFFNWRPSDEDDSAAVQSVLGLVSGAMQQKALEPATVTPSTEKAPPVASLTSEKMDVNTRAWKLMSTESIPTEPVEKKPDPQLRQRLREEAANFGVGAPDTKEDSLFSMGATQVSGGSTTATQGAAEDPGGKEGAFWSGLFTRSKKLKPSYAHPYGLTGSTDVPARDPMRDLTGFSSPKKEAALPSTRISLKGFDWNSDDADAKGSSSASSSSSGSSGEDLSSGNNYMKFLA